MNTSHILHQGVLAAITLARCGAEDGGVLEPDPGVWQGGPSAQGPSPIKGRSRPWSQIVGAEALKVRSKLAPLSLNVTSPLSQHQHPWPWQEQCWSMRTVRALSPWQGMGCGGLASDNGPGCFWCAAYASTSSSFLSPVQTVLWVCVPSSLTTDLSLSICRPHSGVELHRGAGRAVWTWHVWVHALWWSNCHRRWRMFLKCCLCEHQ